jgi:chromosome segregation ATPase
MSAETEEKLASAILSLCDELGQSRAIQADMARTLVQIHEGQNEISAQIRQMVERANSHDKRAGDSEGKIRSIERLQALHESRIQALEKPAKPARAI